MQTQLTEKIKNTKVGQTADAILRRCVHCGFCTATCPTYQLLGDELDGPRGRIYLIKQLLEGQQVTRKTQTHLDRCLTCRSCETTCPSGVEYSHLLDIGRNIVAEKVGRRWYEVILRRLLLFIIPNRHIFSSLVKLAYPLRTILPKATQNMFKGVEPGLSNWPTATHSEKVILIDACAQDELAPRINHATANVLDKLAIEVIRLPFSCCGALAHHLSAEQKSIQTIKHNIDLWWTQIES
ncbi:MAG: glycolate oxidase subunit GlcF, partial [Gammaproteobacteria bacterium]|nr:glycolate oxidase subunit GlcF [Gammaproteobacteria bacterium]